MSTLNIELTAPDDVSKETLEKVVADIVSTLTPGSSVKEVEHFVGKMENRIIIFSRYLRLLRALNLD